MSIFLGKPSASIEAWITGQPIPPPPPPSLESIPLYFTAVDANAVIQLKCSGSSLKSQTFQTSTDGENWTDHQFNSSGMLINSADLPKPTEFTLVNAGDKLYFRAKNDTTSIRRTSSYLQFTTTQDTKLVNVSGNIMSLLAPEFKDLKDLSTIRDGQPGDNEFYQLFYMCKNIQSCENLILPAVTLASGCYSNMFFNCISLTTTPQLNATQLAEGCYSRMFQECTALTTAPSQLNASQLAESCYYYMFDGCTALTTAPQLNATQLERNCCDSMFARCTALTTAPQLNATQLAESCYRAMFSDCSSLTSVPCIKAKQLNSNCCYFMFIGCNNLSSIEVDFEEWNPTNATFFWLNSVAPTGTFTCPSTLPQIKGDSNIPYNWSIITK